MRSATPSNSWVRRRKRTLALIAVGAIAIAACGGDEPEASDDAPAATDAAATPGTEGDAGAGDRPFEGVTLRFGKAPHGEDELANWETWLADFEAETGIEVELTQVPWDQLEALYTANFASNDAYDVTYQTSAHLTLFGDRGVFEDVTPLINGPDFADDLAQFPQGVIDASVYDGKLYGLPFIVGTIAMYVNLDMLESASVEIPTTTEELAAASRAIMDDQAAQGNEDVWGFYTPRTVADFGWYFTMVDAKNRGGDILSPDGKEATFDSAPVIESVQAAADLICTAEVQPPIGQYNREAAIELFRAGKLAFILDEPSRVAVFEEEGLPFEWDIAMPVGHEDVAKQFATTGHWTISSRSENKDASWEFVKWLSTAEFSSDYNQRYAFVPARLDADASGGNEKLERNASWVDVWDGLRTSPQISQLLDEYAQALEAAASCSTSAEEALSAAQERADAIIAAD
jgi:multiple sugar transport system substrate-binding protein